MNPDLVSAIALLRAGHVISGGRAALFDRVARRQLVSIRLEIRVRLYAGALMLPSGGRRRGLSRGGGAGEKF